MNWAAPAAEVSASPEAMVRLLEPGDGVFHAAVAAALSSGTALGHPAGRGETVEFLRDAARRSLTVCPVVTVFDSDRLVASAFALESPGRAALVFTSPPEREKSWISTLSALVERAFKRSNLLLEMLLQPDDGRRGDLLSATGFRRLTRLSYLRLPATSRPVNKPTDTSLAWLEFSDKTRDLFRQTIQESYRQSLDCPELTGLRSIDDVLAAHQAAGEFDAALWQVVHRAGEPLGVVLLARITGQRAAEVVYMGVAPQARGQGIGDMLIARAIELTSPSSRVSNTAHPLELVLAVDERNAPAKHLYARWGFEPIGERDAWIATPVVTRG